MVMTAQVAYPYSEGARFDYDYYIEHHVPLVHRHLDPAGLSGFSASRGIGGRPMEAPPPFFLIATLTFPDEESLKAVLAVAEPVIADIANFTDVTPHFMIGTVLEESAR